MRASTSSEIDSPRPTRTPRRTSPRRRLWRECAWRGNAAGEKL